MKPLYRLALNWQKKFLKQAQSAVENFDDLISDFEENVPPDSFEPISSRTQTIPASSRGPISGRDNLTGISALSRGGPQDMIIQRIESKFNSQITEFNKQINPLITSNQVLTQKISGFSSNLQQAHEALSESFSLSNAAMMDYLTSDDGKGRKKRLLIMAAEKMSDAKEKFLFGKNKFAEAIKLFPFQGIESFKQREEKLKSLSNLLQEAEYNIFTLEQLFQNQSEV